MQADRWTRWVALGRRSRQVVLLSALTGHTLGSFERYGLGAFPLVLALALVIRPPSLERAVLFGCGAAMSGFTALVFLGAFVP